MESQNKTEITEKRSVCFDLNSNGPSNEHEESPPKIDNLEHFPAEILLSIFNQTDDIDLASLGLISARFEPMVREVLTERYPDRFFLIKGESERQQNMYSKLLNLFGNSIRAIEVNGIRHIDDDHWLVQLLNKQTSNVEKLCFTECSFQNVDLFLTQHIKITHLAFRGGSCEGEYRIQLPKYRNLKSLELFKFCHISKPSLEQVLLNNRQMERLILKLCEHYFKLPDLMKLIYTYQTHLKELNISDNYDYRLCDSFTAYLVGTLIEPFVNALKSLESFGVALYHECERSLVQSIGSNCKSIKHFELYYHNQRREIIELMCSFNKVETLSLNNCYFQEYLPTIVENLPNLRHVIFLYNSHMEHFSDDDLLEIIRNSSKHLKEIVIETKYYLAYDKTFHNKNLHFHREFIKAIPNPHFRLEFREKGEAIAVITKEEIIWRNKLLHWVGYKPINSYSDLRLLDLATIPKWSTGKHKHPLNLIFNYLDLDSLYSFSMASEESKQLVDNYIQQRCKTPHRKRAKQRSRQRGKFFVTDEFREDFNGLQMFGKSVKHLDANLLDDRNDGLCDVINEHCKFLTTLCLRAHRTVYLHSLYFPKCSTSS
ncbi:uncharacterized protein LOC129574870 [Sitodiplosis mosellana]|uniref:uncharacterized protein LOC129574870 n=1 Tax=Sitodiplosis mosellana TaxID=263140 RepID=UPI002443B37F|nr:uncharacterized protein LOC129574870 [Sitodiplosis mosellana]